MYCYLSFRSLQPTSEPSTFVVDISETLETKMAAIACYKTQFPPAKAENLLRFRAYAEQQGMAAGFAAGEVLASPAALGVRDLMGFTFLRRHRDKRRRLRLSGCQEFYFLTPLSYLGELP